MRSLFLLVLVFFTSVASAVTGNDLKEGFDKGYSYSLGYTHAVISMSNACIPQGVTLDQGVEIVKKYLRENPEKLHYTANALIEYALLTAYPCQKKKIPQ